MILTAVPETNNDRRIRRRQRRRKKTRRRIFIFLLLLVTVVVMLVTPIFGITSVQCKGNSLFTNEEIAAMSGIKAGANIFLLNKSKVREQMLKNPYLETVTVRRNYPNMVVLIVTETNQAAVIENNQTYVVIDKKGKVLEILNNIEGLQLPVIKNLNLIDFSIAEQYKSENIVVDQRINTVLNSLYSTGLASKTNAIKINAAGDVIISIEDRIEALLGNERFESSIAQLNEIIKDIKPNERLYFDFTNEKQTTSRPLSP